MTMHNVLTSTFVCYFRMKDVVTNALVAASAAPGPRVEGKDAGWYKLAGSTFLPGGQNRIRFTRKNTPMYMKYSPVSRSDTFKGDVHAIGVFNHQGLQLGYLSAATARRVHKLELLEKGLLRIKSWKKVGGQGSYHFGVRLFIVESEII